jgi:hypothetical protein
MLLIVIVFITAATGLSILRERARAAPRLDERAMARRAANDASLIVARRLSWTPSISMVGIARSQGVCRYRFEVVRR